MSRCRSGAGRAVLLIMFAVCCSDKCFLTPGIMVQTSMGRYLSFFCPTCKHGRWGYLQVTKLNIKTPLSKCKWRAPWYLMTTRWNYVYMLYYYISQLVSPLRLESFRFSSGLFLSITICKLNVTSIYMAYHKVRQRSKVTGGLRGVWYGKLCGLSFFVPGPSRGRQTIIESLQVI